MYNRIVCAVSIVGAYKKSFDPNLFQASSTNRKNIFNFEKERKKRGSIWTHLTAYS